MTDITLLVNSCDSYSDTWDPFFHLLDKYWENFNMPVILNTETTNYQNEKFEIYCPTVEKLNKKKMPWGERLIKTISFVETNYILLMLDDFFITQKVDIKSINYFLDLMKKNDFEHILLHEGTPPNYPTKWSSLLKRGNNAPYKFSLQAGLWNKNALIKYLRKHETPWLTELWATKRAQILQSDFYCLNLQKIDHPIQYTGIGIGGIHRGKWLKEKVYDFFKREGIEVNFQNRGFFIKAKRRNLYQRFKHRLSIMPMEIKSRLGLFRLKLLMGLKKLFGINI